MSEPQHLATNMVVRMTNQSSLAIVEIAVFGMTLLVSGFAIMYQGHLLKGKGGWISGLPQGMFHAPGFLYIFITSLVTIIGAAGYVNQEVNQHLVWPDTWIGNPLLDKPDPTYTEMYATTSFISAAPLLMAALSFSQFENTASRRGMGKMFLMIVQLLPLLAFVLGIAGGSRYGMAGGMMAGQNLLEASAILLLISLTFLVGLTAMNLTYVNNMESFSIAISIPFLIIRIIYNVLTAFADPDTEYSFNLPALPIQIFMRIIFGFMIIIFLIFTGFGVMVKPEAPSEYSRRSDSAYTNEDSKSMEMGRRVSPPGQSYLDPHNRI